MRTVLYLPTAPVAGRVWLDPWRNQDWVAAEIGLG